MSSASFPARLASTPPGSASALGGDVRRRHKARDDAIRRKIDQELLRKGGRRPAPPSRSNTASAPPLLPNAKAGTVAALRPTPPITIRQTMRVLDGAQLMAARRCDALLVVDQQDRLCGIVTDKDLTFRVVAEGRDPIATKISDVMTKDVEFVNANQTASEALSAMIQGGFRHLPVMDDEGDVVGILDITKCLYEALDRVDKIYGSSKKLTDALEDVQRDWALTGINAALSQQFEMIRQKMLCPDLASVMAADTMRPPKLGVKATVRDAARAMKAAGSTATLIFDENAQLAGIFTSKDVVLRVVAVKGDPNSTSVIRVMTPRPDTVTNSATIYEALKMMHDNHYLHLPVVDAQSPGAVLGLIDVLKLTYTVLDKIHTVRDQDGPAWDDFWKATFAPESTVNGGNNNQHDVDSVISATTGPAGGSIIRPSDSASVISDGYAFGLSQQQTYDPDQCFVFKFRDPSTMAVHRVTSPLSLAVLVTLLKEKIGPHVEINTLSYSDDDGDDVTIQTDVDLVAAVAMARDAGLRRILLAINGVRPTVDSPAAAMSGGTAPARRRSQQGDMFSDPVLVGVGAEVPPMPPKPASVTMSQTSATRSLGGGAVASSSAVGSAMSGATVAPKRSWMQTLFEHPAMLVGMGALTTLSMVGLASLVRR
ncbi:hypothetical protein GGF32_004597 [Allomyces javanicus]|nr:hypothetical protein GGF32_004597 [Allomyces javanicus]